MLGVIVFSKIKLHPIFGTGGRFSILAMLGPVIPAFVGGSFGAIAIFGARFIQLLIGISQAKSWFSYISYTPLFLAGIYFARMFKKKANHAIMPIIIIFLFIIHPIGRQVWYFSLFWLIPIIITFARPYLWRLVRKHDIPLIYLYSLSATFIDHAVGSVMYLYYLNIPPIYWITAIPYVLPERALFALGITFFYLFIRESLRALQRSLPIKIVIIEENISGLEHEELREELSLRTS